MVLLLALCLVLFLPGINLPFHDPDEGLFGTIAREMVEGGDWVTPRFNGLRYLEKPPFYYWLTALTYSLFGVSEWGARIWPALGATGTALLTALLGRDAFGRRAGLVAGLACATSLGLFIYGRAAGVELLFTALLTLAFLGFFRWARTGTTAPLISFYVALALAVMTKGILALLLASIVIVAFLLFVRPRPGLRGMGLAWGVPLMLVLVLPWHVLAARTNSGFFLYYVGETNLMRFFHGTGAIEDEPPLSTPVFLLVSLIWFFPWSFFLPSALISLARRWRSLSGTERRGWMMSLFWAGGVFALFSLSSFKLEHYALPAFPALALLVAGLWQDARPGRLLDAPLVAGSALALALAGIAFAFPDVVTRGSLQDWLSPFDVYYRMLLTEGSPFPLPDPGILQRPLRGMALALVLAFGGATLAFWRGALRLALGCLLAGTIGFLLAVGVLSLEIAPHQSVKSVAQMILRLASPEDIVIYEGYLENAGGLPYYTCHQIRVLGSRRGDLAFGSRFPEANSLFYSRDELTLLWQGEKRVFLVTDRPLSLTAVQTLPAERRHLLLLDHGKRLYSNRPLTSGSPGATCVRRGQG